MNTMTQLNHETRREYEKRRAAEIAQAAIDAGFRAFIAEQGNYGFYTDDEGSRLVDFQVNGYFEESVSGNYVTSNPQQCGQGWRIADSVNTDMISEYFNQTAPRWATGRNTWRYKTLAEHQSEYQASSRYTEVQS